MKGIAKILKLIFIVALLVWFTASTCTSQIWIDTVYTQTDNVMSRQLQFYGEWRHMTNKVGSYPLEKGAYAYYKGWFFGVSIFTEREKRHADYIVNVDGVDVDTVRVQKDVFDAERITWFNHHMSYGNHELRLRSLRTDSVFVIKRLLVLVDSAPYQIPFYMNGDTIKNIDVIIPGDSIYEDDITVVGDSIYEDDIIIPGDSVREADIIIPGDTIKDIDITIPGDSIFEEDIIISGDSIFEEDIIVFGDTLCIPCPEYPDCPECPPVEEGNTKIPIWVWGGFSLLSLGFILLLIFLRRRRNGFIKE